MNLDLVFHGAPTAAAATLAQLAGDLGVTVDLIARRMQHMEIFSVSVLTVRLGGADQNLDAANAWLARRGVHQLAA